MEYGLADMNKKSVTGIARYRTKADGTLYVNEWYTISSSTYYYGEGGKAYTGFRTVHGKSYYFNEYDGSLYRNIAFKVDGENYYSDSEGIVIKLENNGWMKILFYK